jgi:hypothetical protein
MKSKIKLGRREEIYPGSTLYEITGMDYHFHMGSGVVTSDGQKFKATIYELGDTPMYSAWRDTPRKAVNAALSQFDMKLGMEGSI